MKKKGTGALRTLLLVLALVLALAGEATWYYAIYYNRMDALYPRMAVLTPVVFALFAFFAHWSDKKTKRWAVLPRTLLSVALFAAWMFGVTRLLMDVLYGPLWLGLTVPLVLAAAQGVWLLLHALKEEWKPRVWLYSLLPLGVVLALGGVWKSGVLAKKPEPPIQPVFTSQNLMAGASVTSESLRHKEKPDAANLLDEGDECWTAQDPARWPAEGQPDVCGAAVEIQLAKSAAFNTAVIEEVGNEVQYFRLQAWVDGEWVTVYQSEKIQTLRLLSFDAVTTDRVRLSIDAWRKSKTPAKLKSLRLYNEPKRAAGDFTAAAYQRLDGDVPTEVLARGEEYVRNYARFYDVYNTIIVFAAVDWDAEGNMRYHVRDGGEEAFARELAALRQIIAQRTNKAHEVKIIVTALADGTNVNAFMKDHRDKVVAQMIELFKKYDLDGLDIDWEYPWSAEDWHNFDLFIAQLDDEMKAIKPKAILSGALSAWGLKMEKATLQRFDQIQFMAYDSGDIDGYQSSLQEAQDGLLDFVRNGADLRKINIGIAAYGRPLNSAPFWCAWRDLPNANYWDSKYYHVRDSGQIYDGAFCAPALAGDKAAYAWLTGAGGVMVFRLACDKTMDDPNSIAGGIQNALARYTENW
ncbi:MAG: glycoside hydrolase family 18 protein [Oscillospiraceae bacterium]|jgi:hypothetical protein|nr:glycoside hydrolase family 18 protein [Oscillospiraceae bacterium]